MDERIIDRPYLIKRDGYCVINTDKDGYNQYIHKKSIEKELDLLKNNQLELNNKIDAIFKILQERL